jgi:tRNA threonylcarbamoyladenosine biosynthesis protein TsaE
VKIWAASPEDTRRLGESVGGRVFPGAVLALRGELGAGKTLFASGVARGMGVLGPVTSPTYALVAEYEGSLPLRHVDLYRLNGPEAVVALGIEEHLGKEGVWMVEWPERAEWLLPADRLDVRIGGSGEGRWIEFLAGARHHRLLGPPAPG